MAVLRPAFALRALSLSVLSVLSAPALSGGFDLPTVVASHQGTSNANGAEANDPSVIYYNPAGLTRLRGLQVSQGVSALLLRGKAKDTGSTGTPEPGDSNTEEGRPLSGDPYANGNSGSFWPQILGAGGLFVSMPIDDMITAGVGIYAPGGGNLNFKKDFASAYQADSVAIELISVNPSVGVRFDDKHSIGFGVSVIGGHLKQRTQIDVQGVLPYLLEPVLDGAGLGTIDLGLGTGDLLDTVCGVTSALGICDLDIGTVLGDRDLRLQLAQAGGGLLVDPASRGGAKVEMYGYGLGYNLGYLFTMDDKTRFGLAYRGKSHIKFRGKLEWDLDDLKETAAGGLVLGAINGGNTDIRDFLAQNLRPDTKAKGDFILPARLSASVFRQLTDKIDVMMDATFMQTSDIEKISVQFSDKRKADGTVIKQGDGAIIANWRDSYKISVGGNYRYDDKLTLKSGFQYDRTPVPSEEFRHPGAPDSDRYMYSVGANYKLKKNLSVDGAYSIVFLDDSKSEYRDPCRGVSNEETGESCTGNGGVFRGTFSDTYIQVLSVQLNQRF